MFREQFISENWQIFIFLLFFIFGCVEGRNEMGEIKKVCDYLYMINLFVFRIDNVYIIYIYNQ